MSNEVNHQVRLAARPQGTPGPEVWEHTTEPVPEPGEGRIVVRVSHISLDPAMRGWMNEGRSYAPPVGIGEVMRALGLGEVVASRNADFAVGDTVTGVLGVQEYVESDGRGLQKVSPTADVPPERYLALLGMTGMTAYFGLFDVGALKEGDTVVVSGAAGAVGSVVGQLAKVKGARVVGIAGGPEKCAWITGELGFDAAIDYRSENVSQRLKELAPEGVDVYFDNVGGAVTEAVLFQMNLHGRVACCGAVSQYDTMEMASPRGLPGLLVVKRLRMEGFIVLDFVKEDAKAEKDLLQWASEGKIKVVEDILDGLESAPRGLIGLLAGENRGKRMIRVG
jgi:NADPH-dependent curcumin reductase CurA